MGIVASRISRYMTANEREVTFQAVRCLWVASCVCREITLLSAAPPNSAPAAGIHLLKLIPSCMPACISQ